MVGLEGLEVAENQVWNCVMGDAERSERWRVPFWN